MRKMPKILDIRDSQGDGALDALDTALSSAKSESTTASVQVTSGRKVTGTSNWDVIVTGNGADSVNALAGNDTITTLGGNDTIDAGTGADVIEAGTGNDQVQGGKGSDVISGFSGADFLRGGDGNDTIVGGADGDRLYGDAGNDVILSAGGTDHAWGGAGNDRFGFSPGSTLIVRDWTENEDKLDLRSRFFDADEVADRLTITSFAGGTRLIFDEPVGADSRIELWGVNAATISIGDDFLI